MLYELVVSRTREQTAAGHTASATSIRKWENQRRYFLDNLVSSASVLDRTAPAGLPLHTACGLNYCGRNACHMSDRQVGVH
jgi:hypothetical protein